MKHYIIFLSFLFFVPIAKAKVHIEPYGSIGASYSSAISSNPLFMNYALGTRLGYQFLSISAGLDLFWTHYNIGSSSNIAHLEVFHSSEPKKGFNQAAKSVAVHYSEMSEHFQPFSLGAFLALDLPFLFNAYGTLFYSFGEKSVNHQGYGVKAGLSYLSSLYVQLNLELQWAHYVCMSEADCSSNNNFNIMSAVLSLSVPISKNFFDFSRDDTEEDINSDDTETTDTSSNETATDSIF